jgi:DNA-directed RNA polymerase specialized sigma24 family protein
MPVGVQTSSVPAATSAKRSCFEPTTPRWPGRLQELCRELRQPGGALSSSPETREEFWLLLNSALSRYARWHAWRYGGLPPEDVEDVIAEKSLDLQRKVESGRWDLSERSAGEIAAYISKVARNGLLTCRGRRARGATCVRETRMTWNEEHRLRVAGAGQISPTVEKSEYAGALIACVRQLGDHARSAWIFRAFLRMTTKEIASHPEVQLKPTHVDVLLSRTREAIRECMRSKGYESAEMPPGTFIELWNAFRLGGGGR